MREHLSIIDALDRHDAEATLAAIGAHHRFDVGGTDGRAKTPVARVSIPVAQVDASHVDGARPRARTHGAIKADDIGRRLPADARSCGP